LYKEKSPRLNNIKILIEVGVVVVEVGVVVMEVGNREKFGGTYIKKR